jgi:hypothetical protein
VAVEGFDERILPGCARLDVAGFRVVEAAPVAQRLRDELGAVVAPDQLRRSAASLDYPLERLDCGVGADLLAIGVASASRVCSSVTVRILIGRPSALRSLTKSIARTRS